MSASDPVVVELRAREQHYRALLEALPDLMFRVDRIGTYLEVWPADWPDLVGRNLRDVLPADLAERAMGLVAEVCDGQPIGIVEYDLDRWRPPDLRGPRGALRRRRGAGHRPQRHRS
ncbi:MAG: hypothetical protein M3N33_04165 [Actinomycetota bacterium]|nr:hypothetical protein [Actinomycetota bacterium]